MKKGFVLSLAVLLLFVFTATAYAAQVLVPFNAELQNEVDSSVYKDGKGQYEATVKKFVYDGTTYYPNEIYLPNENPANYRIHSNYSKNTDACAACHATHTAVGESLLQWGTVYDTCMACHDGTIGTTYNVEEGYIANTNTRTFGGMFGVGNEKSLSRHNVVGSLQIFAAPGGNSTGNYEGVVNIGHDSNPKMWDIEFGCESCHSPHGQGGNARILSADPNKIARANYVSGLVYGETFTEGFSKKKVELAYFSNATTPYFVAYENGIKAGNEVTFLKGYPYSTEVWVNGAKSSNFTVDNTAGYTKLFVPGVDPASTTVKVYFFPGVRVKMNITNYLQETENVQHIDGLNYYCGACHTDYNTNLNYNDGSVVASGSGHTLNGKYTEAYRHQVGFFAGYFTDLGKANMKLESNKMSCLTCHYAHGASVELWKDTLDKTFYEFDNSNYQDKLLELAGSSALKRAPNMGTCENCHDKKSGNEGYAANAGSSNAVAPTPGVSDGTSQAMAKYVGSEACAECHKAEYEGWTETWHKNIIRPLTSVPEVYNDWFLPNKDTIASIVGSAYDISDPSKLYILGKEEDYYLLTPNTDDTSEYYRTVNKLLQNKTARYSCGNCHMVNNVTWANTSSITNGLGGVGTKKNIGNYVVNSAMGSTTLKSLLASGGKGTNTKGIIEIGIGCETCHGPGEFHVKSPSSKNITGWKNLPYYLQVGQDLRWKDPNNRTTMLGYNTDNYAMSCGSCHGPGGNIAGHQGFYYKSKHFGVGAMSCTTCHDPHKENAKGQQIKATSFTALCQSCHDSAVGTPPADAYKYLPSAAHVFSYTDGDTAYTDDATVDYRYDLNNLK